MFELSRFFGMDELSEQYRRQAGWSRQVIEYYWPEEEPVRVLDVGCGPVPDYFVKMPAGYRVGVDFDKRGLLEAKGDLERVLANSSALPFGDGMFDAVLCQYLLLWAPMRETVEELWRVTAPGGRLICASEPDYEGRREEPEGIKDDFVEAMKVLGADTGAGVKLEAELERLTDKFETGTLTMVEDKSFQLKELKSDLMFISKVLGRDVSSKAEPLMEALANNQGNIFMPIHYGCAFKSD
jgi:SAM-dependent methyltransferase